jgi:putative oxidoreductase
MDEGLLLLRLLLGLTMAAHGSQKLFGLFGGYGPQGTGSYFASLGYRSPVVVAVLAGLAEFLGGLALAAGFLVPLAAAGIVVVMLNAIESVKFKGGFFAGNGGYEFELLILGAAALAAGILIAFFTMTWGRGEPESTELST